MKFNKFDLIYELNKMEKMGDNDYKFRILKKAILNNIQYCNFEGIALLIYALNRAFEALLDILNDFNDNEKKSFRNNMFDFYLNYLKRFSFSIGNIESFFIVEYRNDIQKQIYDHWNSSSITTDNKSFIDVFEDLHENCLSKYPNIFVKRLGDLKNLYRAQRGKHFNNYERMIPKEEFVRDKNRWNPEGVDFLYLGYGDKLENFGRTINIIEKTCFEELRLKKGEDVTVCRFEAKNKDAKIINLCYEDISLDEIESEQQGFINDLSQKKVEEILSNKALLKKLSQSENKSNEIWRVINKKIRIDNIRPIIRGETEKYLGKFLMKNIDEAVFLAVDKKDDPELNAYIPFHLLSKFLIEKGYAGILYRSTRMNLIGLKGKNLVLFDKNDANFIKGTLKVYHYGENDYCVEKE